MRVRDGLAEVDGRVGRLEARLMLDTGAQNCIVNLQLAAALQAAYPLMRRRPKTRVTGVTGQVIVGDYLELPDVRLGAVTVKDSGAVAIDAPIFKVWGLDQEPAMIVGVNVLSRLATFSIDDGAKMFNAVPMALGTGDGVMLG